MNTLLIVLGVMVVSGIMIYFISRSSGSRLFQAGRAQLGKVGRFAIEADPIAVLQDRRDQAAETLTDAIKIQSDCRGHIESHKRQVISGQQETSRLDAKIRSALNVRDEDKAAQYAMQLEREKEHLSANEKQLSQLQGAYDSNMKKIKAAQSAISTIDDDARRLKVDLKFSKVEKELGEMMSKVQVGVDMGSVNEAKEEARRQIDRNRGAALVQAELGSNHISEIELQEQERQDRAKSILDEYKKNM